MSRRLIVRTLCPICGEQVEPVPDAVLKREPHHKNAEMVVTRTGYKQYIHTSCWYGMIAEQKKKRKAYTTLGGGETIWLNSEEPNDGINRA